MPRLSIALSALLIAAATGPGRAAEVGSAKWPARLGSRTYEVTRDGDPIGTQTVTLGRNGAELTVQTDTSIAVTMLGLVVYRMEQSLVSTYRDRKLVSVSAATKEPGGVRRGKLTRSGDRWVGTNGDEPRDFVCDCESSALWHVSRLRGSAIIDAASGEPRAVRIADNGTDFIDLPQGKVPAHHFTVSGGIERELWYDAAGNMVASEQRGSDGSRIRQTLIR